MRGRWVGWAERPGVGLGCAAGPPGATNLEKKREMGSMGNWAAEEGLGQIQGRKNMGRRNRFQILFKIFDSNQRVFKYFQAQFLN
jgi:hypothetical protein